MNITQHHNGIYEPVSECTTRQQPWHILTVVTTQRPSEDHPDTITVSNAVTADIEQMSVVGTTAFLAQFEDAPEPLHARINAVNNQSIQLGFAKDLTTALNDNSKATIVARNASGEVLGFAQLSKNKPCVFLPKDHDTTNWASLDMLYVNPEHHGKSVRTRLMQAAEEICRKEGAEMMWLIAYERNLPALILYKKCGFGLKSNTVFDKQIDARNSLVLVKSIRD